MKMTKLMWLCFLFLSFFVTFLPFSVEAKLIDILANELNYNIEIQELETLQKEAQFNYSDEYANYKLDMKELQKRREKLLKALSSEETRKEIVEKGLGVQFQLKFYANLVTSLINVQERIHHLLVLKDLRMDVLDRLPVLAEKHNNLLRKMIQEDTKEKNKVDKEIRALKAEVVKLKKGKQKSDFTREDIKRMKAIYERYRYLTSDSRQKETAIARFQRDIDNSKRSMKNIDRIRPHIEEAFTKLGRQRERLQRQVVNLKRDVQALSVNVSTGELIAKMSSLWTEVTDISTDLGKFVADYSELEKFQEAIQTAQVKREDITLERVLTESQENGAGNASEQEIMEWVNSLK